MEDVEKLKESLAARAAKSSTTELVAQIALDTADQVEFKQLVRSIGAASTPEIEDVRVVDARITELMNEGWEVLTAQALASVPGGVTVYYALVRYHAPEGSQ